MCSLVAKHLLSIPHPVYDPNSIPTPTQKDKRRDFWGLWIFHNKHVEIPEANDLLVSVSLFPPNLRSH